MSFSVRIGVPSAIAALVALVATSVACDGATPTRPDGGDGSPADGGADGDGDADGDAGDADVPHDGSADATEDGDTEPVGGAMTLLFRGGRFLPERRCDHDGDGTLDNAMADLGASAGAAWAMIFSTVFDEVALMTPRVLVHSPWVEDLTGPTDGEINFIILDANDLDVPPDLSDDLSGHEPFEARGYDLDGCGEPLTYFSRASVEEGHFEGYLPEWALFFHDTRIHVRDMQTTGDIEPGGASALLTACGYARVADLGESQGAMGTAGLSLLEELLGGGAALGFPALPPLRPDLDLDGDGLESLEVDETGHIFRCIDGDRTVIEGADCWQDPRIADAISVLMELDFISAVFAGLEPNWRDHAQGDCPEGPPEESLFDPT